MKVRTSEPPVIQTLLSTYVSRCLGGGGVGVRGTGVSWPLNTASHISTAFLSWSLIGLSNFKRIIIGHCSPPACPPPPRKIVESHAKLVLFSKCRWQNSIKGKTKIIIKINLFPPLFNINVSKERIKQFQLLKKLYN